MTTPFIPEDFTSARLLGALALALFVPFLVSRLACLFIIKYGPAVGLVDKPGERKIHNVPKPTGGGLGIWLAVTLPLACVSLAALGFRPESNEVWGYSIEQFPDFFPRLLGGVSLRLGQLWTLLGLGTALTVLGVLDDRYNLRWQVRLGIEFAIAAIAVASGWRATFFIDAPYITYPLSALWIVGLINSFNMLDNMDGLSGGVATICALVLSVVTMCFAPNPTSGEPQFFLSFFFVLLAGAILGFLSLNRPPARIFMGDCGAYFLGFLLATLTLSTTFVGAKAPKSAIFTPLVVLALPLYDTLSVVTIRLRNGKSPFVGDKNHYSHRLVALGLTKGQAVATIYLTTAICALGSFFLYQVSFFCACLVLAQTALILALVAILEFAARKKIREDEELLAKRSAPTRTNDDEEKAIVKTDQNGQDE